MKKALIIFILMLIIPLVSSEIIFTEQPKNLYNVGDLIEIEIKIDSPLPSSDYVQAILDCEDDKVIFKQYEKFDINEKKFFTISAVAEKRSDCRIIAEFNSEDSSSENFEITDKIILDFNLNNRNFIPGEEIKINGTAIKQNKKNAEGIAVISLDDIFMRETDIENGIFSFEYVLENDIPPGDYELKIIAREKNTKNKIINQGMLEKKITIKSKPSFIKIDSVDSVKPPKEIWIYSELLDQAKNKINDEKIILNIFTPNDKKLKESIISSGDKLNINLPPNASRGAWAVRAYHGKLSQSFVFYVEENQQLDYLFSNTSNSLIIKNIGNIDYNGILNINLTNSSEKITHPINISIPVNSQTEYLLPQKGNYNVTVKNQTFQNVYLTGASVFNRFSLGLWSTIISFIIVLIVAGFFIYKKLIPFIFEQLKKQKINKPQKPEFVKLTEKRIYSFFIKSDNLEKITKIISQYNFKINKVNNEIAFILNYSSNNKKELKLVKLAKIINRKFPNSSIIIHSDKFENKASSIKSALEFKHLLSNLKGVLITETFYNELKNHVDLKLDPHKQFQIRNKHIKLYKLSS